MAVAESAALDPDLLRRLAWRLEGPRIDLLVSPVLSDVAGPAGLGAARFRAAPAAPGRAALTGPKRALKRLVDLAVSVPS